MKKSAQAILLVFVVAGLASAGAILAKRAMYEKANRTVEIVIDERSLDMVSPVGSDRNEIVRRFAAAGATSIGVYETTIGDLIDTDQLRVMPQAVASASAEKRYENLMAPRSLTADHLLHDMAPAYFGDESCPKQLHFCAAPVMDIENMRDMTLGMSADNEALPVSPRMGNSPYETAESLRVKIRGIEKLKNHSSIIFDGESIMGYPGLIEALATELKKNPKLTVGVVEMVEQKGLSALAAKIPDQVISVHSISYDEMLKSNPRVNVSRFARAARERGARILYARLFVEDFGDDRRTALEENLKYIETLSEAIQRDGFKLAIAKPLPPFETPKILKGLAAAGAAALALLLIGAFLEIPAWVSLPIVLLCVPVFLFAPAGVQNLAVRLATLGVACVTPGLAAAIFFLRRGRAEKMGEGANFGAWMCACAVSVAGGLFIGALLSERSYFLRLGVFSGVKIAFVLPLIFVLIAWLRATGESVREFLDSPMRYGEVVLGMILAVVLAVYLLRSGNQPPVGVSDAEKTFRGGLEMFFYARPRTKEFLLGHPAMLMMGLIPLRKRNFLFPALFILATMGQVSIVNSFCHLHTPIVFTLIRVALGLALGAIVGMGCRAAASVAMNAWPIIMKKTQ